jgi:CheY-like chemotaxis protein
MNREDHPTPEEPVASGGGRAESLAFLQSVRSRAAEHPRFVIVADDSDEVRRLVARDIRIADAQVEVIEAANGREAIEALARLRAERHCDPLFIVLDLKMPVLDGWDVIDALHKEYASKGLAQGIPIIVLSSTSGEKGVGPFRHSIHGRRTPYIPLVGVAKEACADPRRYDAFGEKGLVAWVEHFLRYG